MTRFLLPAAAALAVAAIASQASAADLATRPMYSKAPAYAPVNSWTGWYFGGNVGWTAGSGSVNNNAAITGTGSFAPVAPALASSASPSVGSADGFIGGMQVGYNFQVAPSLVAGWEADFQGLSSPGKKSATSTIAIPGSGVDSFATTTTVSHSLSYLGTLRGRLGVTVTPALLLYATGGLAYGGANADTSINSILVNDSPNPSPGAAGSYSGTRVGYAVGAGGEWQFASNWSMKVEYLHYDLGSATYSTGSLSQNEGPTANLGGGTDTVATSTRVTFKDDIVRFGINYHLN